MRRFMRAIREELERAVDHVVYWSWRWLPDRCEMEDCDRRGVRGEEKIVRLAGKLTRVCERCHRKIMRNRMDHPAHWRGR